MATKRKCEVDDFDSATSERAMLTWLNKITCDAVEYIKKDFLSDKNRDKKDKSWIDIDRVWDYLSVPQIEQSRKSAFVKNVHAHPRVETKDEGGAIAVRFCPIKPATNVDDLLEYLASQKEKKVTVADLLNGWPNCEPELDRLERAHHILVHRLNGKPRAVWLDSPELHIEVGADFRELWSGIAVPESLEKMREELKETNMTMTSEKKEVEVVKPGKGKLKRRGRGKGIQTNVHMKSVLKDYRKK